MSGESDGGEAVAPSLRRLFACVGIGSGGETACAA
jgi:hypothetical protein